MESSDPSTKAVKPDPCWSWKGHPNLTVSVRRHVWTLALAFGTPSVQRCCRVSLEFSSYCEAITNGCLAVSHCFSSGGLVKWSRCADSKARRAEDNLAVLRRNSAAVVDLGLGAGGKAEKGPPDDVIILSQP